MSSAITFSFGILKTHRMWRHKKRYFLFTAIGAYPFCWMIEDISYFIYIDPRIDRLCPESWTNWVLGGFQAGRVWIPNWWIITTVFSFSLFFLAYRSALYNLLLEREVESKLATQQPAQPQELAPEPEPAAQEPTPPPEPATEEEIRRRLLVKKALKEDA